jgi:hypothetical protein
MIINRNPFDLLREGPNQQVQDLGQLLPGPGMNAQTGDFSGIGYIYMTNTNGKLWPKDDDAQCTCHVPREMLMLFYLSLPPGESSLEVRQTTDSWPTLFIWCT